MSSVSKDENTTKQTRTRNRNRRRTNITNNKENRTDSRGRRKGGENVKKKNEEKTPTETPVIGSSNPFFIAVCAPDTYTSSMTPTGGFQQRVKPNVFLRPRSRAAATSSSYSSASSFTTYAASAASASTHANGSGANAPNRFIHHPALQQSRNMPTTCSTTTCSDNGNNVIPISDFTHFPSLSATTTDAIASVAPVKLNFKEMMTRSAGGTSAGGTSAVPVPVPVAVPVPVPVAVPAPKTSGIVPQKALSSSNIFLAAFQPTIADANDADADADDDYIGSKPVLASSVLIDSCDKKYDRLYR
jgi:hypothetical protein